MGIYDRDYQRGPYYDRSPGFHFGGNRTLTTNIIILMVAIYLVQILTRGQLPDEGWFTDLFCLHADLPKRPWRFFELVTYGFLHDVWNLTHIIFNMIALWFFGRIVEYRYGQREYLAFFITGIIAAGATWMLGEFAANRQWLDIPMLGASGGISAILIVFCLNYPHQVIYVWGVLPIPAWVFALLFVGQDIFGAGGRTPVEGPQIAYTAHLGGAMFGFLYYQWGWRMERLLPSYAWWQRLKPKPKLRVVDPDSLGDSTDAQVDDILKKIQEHGRDSLTRRERRILEEASRQYQKRRH